jgi:hypothetical protein
LIGHAKRVFQPHQIIFLADFNRAEASQMPGHELAIEKVEPAHLHSRDQPRQRDFRCIGRSAEHALAKKRPAHRHSVEPTDQFAIQPAFDAMRVPHAMKIAKCILDIGIDPRVTPVVARFGASCDHLSKGAICCHGKPLLPDRLCQRLGQLELGQRQNRSLLGLYPEGIGIVPRVRHRENAIGIRAHE